MPKLFGVTLFISATLLFLVQPMVGKMVLPLLGGTPAVWNTCMVFFQALLLAGYYYAHKSTSTMPTRRQVRVHSALLLATIGALAVGAALIENHSPVPIVKSLAPQGSSVPFFGVILLLAAAIGLPFFTVSTTAPLLQKWFSETGHPSAKDPYFLYAASNFGSLLALIGYPFVVEPFLRLVEQAWVWAIGFFGLSAMIVLCARAVLSAPPPKTVVQKPKQQSPVGIDEAPPPWTKRVRWLLLAAIPSSLMLAVTTSVTTDMVSMPLLWVIPLALYLITFIIVFAKSTPPWVHVVATLVTPVLILLVLFTKVVEPIGSIDFSSAPKGLQYFLNVLPFLTFFMIALTCHGELARSRPSSQHLTGFYLTMSLGGVLGGLFNALFAPLVFTFVSEYPITLVAACWLLPQLSLLTNPDAPKHKQSWTSNIYFWAIFWDAIAFLMFFAAGRFLSAYYVDLVRACIWFIDKTGMVMAPKTAATIVGFGLPILASYFFVERPIRFGAVVGAIWLGVFMTFLVNERNRDEEYRTIYKRSFFGTMKVEPYRRGIRSTNEASPEFTHLVHGTTVHGMQHREPDGVSIAQALLPFGANGPADALGLAWIAEPHYRFPGREPLTYYHRSGPVGHMFQAFWDQVDGTGKNTDVAAIGLGTGSLSSYARPNEHMTFFEIDKTVVDLVDRQVDEEDGKFTYMKRAKQQGAKIELLLGDARLTLEQTDRKWGFMLVDAFSSDSIPAHLLTKEAVKLYFNRLEEDGLLALHISNRYLKLEPVVDQIVRDPELKLEAIVMHDYLLENWNDDHVEFSGKLASTWVLVAKRRESFGPLLNDPRWGALKQDESVGLWTDDYTPITRALSGGWWNLLSK